MNEQTTAAAADAAETRRFRPKLALYHANAKGTGGALKMELHPAHDDTDGSIMMQLASQMTVGDLRGPNPVYPRFDWEGAVCVKLDFGDLTKMLQVFRGECESLEDGKGLYHRSPRASTRIVLRHMIDPRPGYLVEVYRSGTGQNPAEEKSARVFLPPNEALGVSLAIEGSMPVVCFGIPTVIARDTSAYRAAAREVSNAAAA